MPSDPKPKPKTRREKVQRILETALPELTGPEHPLHDRFREAYCQHAMANPDLSDAQVYREVANDPILTPTHRTSAKLILADPAVRARIRWLQQQQAARCLMTRDDVANYFVAVMRTPIAELTPEHRIAQKVEYHESGALKRIECPDKLAAAAHLMRMNGWDRPAGEGPPLVAAEAVLFAVIRGHFSA
jgi:hypothetical protein